MNNHGIDLPIVLAGKIIQHKVRDLVRKHAIPQIDSEDSEQDMWTDLIRRWPHFDPSRSSASTFITRIVANYAFVLVRHRRCARRKADFYHSSLNETVPDGAGKEVELCDTLDNPQRTRHRQYFLRSQEYLSDLGMDLMPVMCRVNEDDHAICKSLMKDSKAECSRRVGLSRKQLQSRVRKLARIFKDRDLDEYCH